LTIHNLFVELRPEAPKELLGGIDWWRRDGHPVAASHEPGSLLAAE
jgi:hypothetical protein